MANARRTAVNALLKVNTDKAYSNIALNNILKTSELSSEDRSLATALFYGVLDRRITLDYVLDSLTKIPFKKVNFFTAEVMRVGLYQIMYMDKIPNSAAVDEAVKMIKKSPEHRNSGFVNAVLREATRRDNLLPEGNSVDALSVRYSCPEWIVEELVRDYGTDTAVDFLAETLKVPPLDIRVNTLKTTTEKLCTELRGSGVECKQYDDIDALQILKGVNIENNACFKEGLFHVQDSSSHRASLVLNLKPDERVLDMCAAPGGKTFTMAQIMQNKGEIVSCDLYPHKIKLIESGANRLGLRIIKPIVSDATKYNVELGLFDAVLCDVPCSGLGIIRRKPDIKQKPETDFTELQGIQQSILNNAVNYLKDGGRIVYSTCTVRKAENEGQIEQFLNTHPSFKLEYMKTFMPNECGGDGFFVALLKR